MKKNIIALTVLMLLSLTANANTIAYWRLEEGTAGSTHATDLDKYFVDSSGNGNDMSHWYFPAPVSAVPAATIPQSGLTNEIALNFCERIDNFTNLMCITTHSKPIDSHDFSSGFTIECAMKNRVYNWNATVSKDGKPDPASPFNPFKLLFRYDTVGDARFNYEFMDGASNVHGLFTTFPFKIDEWYWVACVSDGDQAWLYVKEPGDTDYDLEAHVTGVTNGLINTTDKWSVGRGCWDGNNAVNAHYGSIDEVRITEGALSPNQFLAASGGAAVSPEAYWRFEEGTNGVHQGNLDDYYVDSSGNGNHMATDINPVLSTASSDVPFSIVPQTGEADTMSRSFDTTIQNVGTFGDETGGNTVDSINLESFTVELMAKANVVGWQMAICKNGEPSWNINGWVDPAFVIKFRADNKIQLAFFDKTTNFVECWSSFDYTPGEWYQIAAVYDNYTGEAKLYIKEESDSNYELEETKTTTWAGTPIVGGLIESSYPWSIGRGSHWGEQRDGLDGVVDEVRISDTALDVSQFLGNLLNTKPIFYNVQFSPYPTPTENDIVTIQAIITISGATVTNVTLDYSVNSGSYLEMPMATNTTPGVFLADIPAQATNSVVDFIITAVNSEAQTASYTSRYDVVQSMEWETVMVATNCPLWNPNMTSMAIAPNGHAGFVFREGGISARYVEESSLGVLETPVAISTNLQGLVSNIRFGSDNEPRASLSYDVDDFGGVTYVQRTNGVWISPIMVVTNFFNERRHAMTLTDDKPSILWYENYQAAGYFGKLCDGNTAGDIFTCMEVDVPPFPNIPGDLRRPFAIASGTDNKRRIALHGPGLGDDRLYYGLETAVGSKTFDWEEVTQTNDFYAEQIGFALDNNNYPYIVLRNLHTNPTCATLFYNTGSGWIQQNLSPQDFWNRAAVAYDSWNDCMWVVHNSAGFGGKNFLHLWSDRSGSWKQEMVVTNNLFIETFSGFEVTDLGVMKLAFSPAHDSPDFLYMYSTTFSDIPEPTVFIWIVGLLGLWIGGKKFKA